MNINSDLLANIFVFSLIESILFYSVVLIDRKLKTDYKLFIGIIALLTVLNVVLSKLMLGVVFQIVYLMVVSAIVSVIHNTKLLKTFISVFNMAVIMIVFESIVILVVQYIANIDYIGLPLYSFEKIGISFIYRILEFGYLYILFKRRSDKMKKTKRKFLFWGKGELKTKK